MPTSTKKIDIAAEYLRNALELYRSQHYFSALTLGAAAEEILGKCIKHLPKMVGGIALSGKNALADDIDAQQSFDQTLGLERKSTKEILDTLLLPKNSTKHFDDPIEDTVDLDDVQLAAGDFLLRAIRNYRMVFPGVNDHYYYEEEDIKVYQLNSFTDK
jgi:hypothetical protein